ncbi:MAG: hypothetical protein LUG55_05570 [Clostridiales bacterium]|nr:hypothetical protein [Clostridiales bacterium]
MKEHGISDVENLAVECDAAVERYHELADKTKSNEARMKEIAELQRQIGTYGKTREIYLQYKKLPQKKQAAFYEAHRSDIVLHEASKRYFDSLGLEKLPSIKSLKQEYAALSAENKQLYPDQKTARRKMIDLPRRKATWSDSWRSKSNSLTGRNSSRKKAGDDRYNPFRGLRRLP